MRVYSYHDQCRYQICQAPSPTSHSKSKLTAFVCLLRELSICQFFILWEICLRTLKNIWARGREVVSGGHILSNFPFRCLYKNMNCGHLFIRKSTKNKYKGSKCTYIFSVKKELIGVTFILQFFKSLIFELLQKSILSEKTFS